MRSRCGVTSRGVGSRLSETLEVGVRDESGSDEPKVGFVWLRSVGMDTSNESRPSMSHSSATSKRRKIGKMHERWRIERVSHAKQTGHSRPDLAVLGASGNLAHT